MKITSTEFQQNIGRYQDAAQHAPVVITKNARPHTVLVSAAFFEMVMKGRVARRIEDLDDDTLEAIANSAVSPRHDELNELLKDWNP
jgi:prevent-host-death family protein